MPTGDKPQEKKSPSQEIEGYNIPTHMQEGPALTTPEPETIDMDIESIREYREIQQNIAQSEIVTKQAAARQQALLISIEKKHGIVIGRDQIDLNTFRITKG